MVITPELAQKLFKHEHKVFVSYKDDQRQILISSSTNSWFAKLHQFKECLLKDKDMQGTKSISIRDMIIDHDISDKTRQLSFQVNLEKKFLKVFI